MVVIITGMHRSGTSALAGALHNSGISMGSKEDFFPPPQRENPKGFFENSQFRYMNDAILEKQNYRVKEFDPDVPQALDLDLQIRLEMATLIRKYDSKDIMWGWKDPRNSLTAACWLSVLAEELQIIDQVVILNCVRSPIAIGESMRGRGNKEKKQYQFEALAAAYYSTLHHTTDQWRRPTHPGRPDRTARSPETDRRPPRGSRR